MANLPAGRAGSVERLPRRRRLAAMLAVVTDVERLTPVIQAAAAAGALAVYAGVVGRAAVAANSRDVATGRPLGRVAMFELASLTKPYVGLALARLVVDGVVALDDPVDRFLPASVEGPRHITLRALVSHTSGLPREGPGESDSGGESADELYRQFTRVAIGTAGKYSYSNLGFVLLAHVLALAASAPLPVLLHEQVLLPIGLRRTLMGDAVPAGDRITGRRADTRAEVSSANSQPGAGGLWATGEDVVRWVQAWLSPPPGLEEAMALALTPIHGEGKRRTAFAWRIDERGRASHTGATDGFSSFCGFNPATGSGTVVLLNAGISAVPIRPRTVPVFLRFLRLRRRIAELFP